MPHPVDRLCSTLDDGPPPLEDLAEQVQALKQERERKPRHHPHSTALHSPTCARRISVCCSHSSACVLFFFLCRLWSCSHPPACRAGEASRRTEQARPDTTAHHTRAHLSAAQQTNTTTAAAAATTTAAAGAGEQGAAQRGCKRPAIEGRREGSQHVWRHEGRLLLQQCCASCLCCCRCVVQAHYSHQSLHRLATRASAGTIRQPHRPVPRTPLTCPAACVCLCPCWLCCGVCVCVCAEEVVEDERDEKQHDLPFIRPAANQQSSLRLDEVQQALQGAAAISQTQQSLTQRIPRMRGKTAVAMLLFRGAHFLGDLWRVADACALCADVSNADFLSKLQAQPELLRGLADPRSAHTRTQQASHSTQPHLSSPVHSSQPPSAPLLC